MSPSLTAAASLQLTLPLLLGCAVAVAITSAVAAVYATRHAPGLAGRLRRPISTPPTPDDKAPPDTHRQPDARRPPQPPSAIPDDPCSQPSASPLSGARYAPDTFALVAEHADHTQRLAIAEARVERVLATLPSEAWFIQRFALVAGDRIPFLALGEHGIFAIWAIGASPQWTDPEFVNTIASNLKGRLPQYPGPVNAGLCATLQPDIKPRFWYRCGDGGGAWILGVDWLISWMAHFGHQHGLGTRDITRFRALAKPDWTRSVAPVPPGIPIINTRVNAE